MMFSILYLVIANCDVIAQPKVLTVTPSGIKNVKLPSILSPNASATAWPLVISGTVRTAMYDMLTHK